MGSKGDLQGGEGQLDIASMELLFVANVCVLGTCYHNYKRLIIVWGLRHEPVGRLDDPHMGGWMTLIMGGWMTLTWGFGWRWLTPASVVASRPLVCHL